MAPRALAVSDMPPPLKPAPQLSRSDFQVLAESRTDSCSPSTVSLARIRSIIGQVPPGFFQRARLAASLRHQSEYIWARACKHSWPTRARDSALQAPRRDDWQASPRMARPSVVASRDRTQVPLDSRREM